MRKTPSYSDLITGKCTLRDVMQEFRMNGSDAPYTPHDDQLWASPELPSSPVYTYSRQRSWPGAERAPPRPLSLNIDAYSPPASNTEVSLSPQPVQQVLTEEQRRVLSSLPDTALLSLLRELQRRNKKIPEECRFCKNNGERESFYRGHSLKDARGRVECPVLRAFVCKRCGASGDHAHTIKYCPLSTNEERIKSAAMMRSVRKASGRRRSLHGADTHTYNNLTQTGSDHFDTYNKYTQPGSDHFDIYNKYTQPGSDHFDTSPYTEDASTAAAALRQSAPLDPRWAALEQKLCYSSKFF